LPLRERVMKHLQAPPPKTTNKRTTIVVCAVSLVCVLQFLLCCGGLALLATRPPSYGPWQECVELRERRTQELLAEFKAADEHELLRLLEISERQDRELQALVAKVQSKHGPPPAYVIRKLNDFRELDAYIDLSHLKRQDNTVRIFPRR
jgi:hypothetical protein